MPIDRGRGAKAARFDHGEPIRYISLAPVAGVLLVAAAAVALSFPAKTHALTFDLYGDEFYGDYVDPLYTITLTSDTEDQIYWNGQPISQSELIELLHDTLTQPVEPFFVFSPHDRASYGATATLLNTLKGSGLRKFCIGGLERNRHFERPENLASADARDELAEECSTWTSAAPEGVIF